MGGYTLFKRESLRSKDETGYQCREKPLNYTANPSVYLGQKHALLSLAQRTYSQGDHIIHCPNWETFASEKEAKNS